MAAPISPAVYFEAGRDERGMFWTFTAYAADSVRLRVAMRDYQMQVAPGDDCAEAAGYASEDRLFLSVRMYKTHGKAFAMYLRSLNWRVEEKAA